MAIIAAMDTDPLVERYLNHLRVEGGLSRNTIEAYRRDLAKFQGYLHQQGVSPVQQVSTDTIRPISRVASCGASVAPVFSSLFVGCPGMAPISPARTSYQDNPALDVATRRRGIRLPKTLSQHEVAALLDLPVHSTPEDQRDRVMLELLYATGLRVSELVSVETCAQ